MPDLVPHISYLMSHLSRIMSDALYPTARSPAPLSHVSYLISRTSCLLSRLSYLISRISCLLLRISYRISRISYPTGRISFLISRISYLTSHSTHLTPHVSYEMSCIPSLASNSSFPSMPSQVWCLVSLSSYPLSRISCPNHRISCLVCLVACDIAPTSYLVSHILYTTPCIRLIVPVHPISYLLRRVPHRIPCVQNPTSHISLSQTHMTYPTSHMWHIPPDTVWHTPWLKQHVPHM